MMFLMFTPGHRIFVALNCKTSPRNDASTFEKMLEMKINIREKGHRVEALHAQSKTLPTEMFGMTSTVSCRKSRSQCPEVEGTVVYSLLLLLILLSFGPGPHLKSYNGCDAEVVLGINPSPTTRSSMRVFVTWCGDRSGEDSKFIYFKIGSPQG